VTNIRYLTSTDAGTWSGSTNITSETSYSQTKPTISIDKNNNLYVLWSGRSSGSYDQIRKKEYKNNTWGAVTDVTTSSSGATAPASCANTTSLTSPLYIYKDGTASIKYNGTLSDIIYEATTPGPNTKHSVVIDVKDAAGHITTYSQEVYTKAETPTLTATPASSSINAVISDTNPAGTDYLFMCGNKYVTTSGKLTSIPTWVKFTSKTIGIAGISPNTNYILKIKARNGDGVETDIYTVSVTQNESLAIPTNLKVNTSSNKIVVFWDPVDGATGYNLLIDEGKPSQILIENITETYYSHAVDPGSQHTYKVIAKKGSLTSEWSAVITASAQASPPGVPGNIDTQKGATSIIVSWPSVSGATKYEIEVDGKKIDNGLRLSYTHKGLIPGTQHTYRVRAVRGSVHGGWSEYKIEATNQNKPGLVTGVKAVATDTSATITWNAEPNAQGYKIWFKGANETVATTFVTTYNSFVKYGLTPASTYNYKIAAINSASPDALEESDWVTPEPITTKLLKTPAITGISENETEIALGWTAIEGATSYIIERNSVELPAIPGTSFSDTGLDKNTEYKYRVKAINATGESQWCDLITTMTLAGRPGIPGNITIAASQDAIKLSWNDANPNGYTGNIYYDVMLDGVEIDNDTALEYEHDGLKPNSLHTYQIRSKTDLIESSWSNPITIKTLPGMPEAPRNINVVSSSTGTRITWDPEDGATCYDVALVTFDTSGVEVIAIIGSPTKNEFIYRGTKVLDEYIFAVRTVNMLGESPWTGYIINNSIKAKVKRDETTNLALTATDITDFSQYTMTVTYNPDVLDVDDLCIQTSEKELNQGKINGTGINIVSYSPGKIVFVVDKVVNPEESWTGVINSIRFKAKVTGGTHITYTVVGKPKEQQ
jgi:Fibronectin type III domain.